MNVFVLCTGRCGSTTIVEAFKHATNFTAGHESAACSLYPLAYPDQHVEADNRLSWMLGELDDVYPTARYIHLLRDQHATARSFAARRDFPGASIRGFGAGILGLGDQFPSNRYEVAVRMWEVVNANIRLFVDHLVSRGEQHRVFPAPIYLHNLEDDFPKLWTWLGCEGDLDAAVAETLIRHNAGAGH